MPELKLRKELESLREYPGNHPIHARELIRILGVVLDDLETVRKEIEVAQREAAGFAAGCSPGSGR